MPNALARYVTSNLTLTLTGHSFNLYVYNLTVPLQGADYGHVSSISKEEPHTQRGVVHKELERFQNFNHANQHQLLQL